MNPHANHPTAARRDSRHPVHRDRNDTRPLAEFLNGAETYVLTFGGQGADWRTGLNELAGELTDRAAVADLVRHSTEQLQPVTDQLTAVTSAPFDPLAWLSDPQRQSSSAPIASTMSAGLSIPGVLLTQLMAMDVLRAEGLDLCAAPPTAAIGHSQGILGVAAYAGRRDGTPRSDVDVLSIARLIGAAATKVARRTRLVTRRGISPMLHIGGVQVARIRSLVEEYSHRPGVYGAAGRPIVSVINGPRSLVVSADPLHLSGLRGTIEHASAEAAAAREAKRRGGAPFAPSLQPVTSEIGFHHPDLAEAVDLVRDWADACGLDDEYAVQLARTICVDPVDWPGELDRAVTDSTGWILDLGPQEVSARLTARALRGRSTRVIAAATAIGRDELFTPGARPEPDMDWSRFAPGLIDRGDGRPMLDTAFTRLTGRSPILLAGMTPTTVDPAIVAAAANAGHWAELAGGGQVTAEVLEANLTRLDDLLEEGRTATFNALYLDPYLWQLQVGGQRLVHKARAGGAPIDGVVVSAGIPQVAEAVQIVTGLREAGISHVAFKPGSVAQIRQVLAIAAELSTHDAQARLIVQIEGGLAGGHHSWEDLDELLLACYGALREASNVVVCVGGGIGTPQQAASYLLGTWSHQYGEIDMPVDGVLVGTAAMACQEATTSPAVKELLVRTGGTAALQESAGTDGQSAPEPAANRWVGAGRVAGGITSGRSQLGADIHEIDNAAGRCGRLLDEVAGDAAAVSARREELIAAMAETAKPYFGDVAEMTYEQWLRRYVALAAREETGTAGTVGDGQPRYPRTSTAPVWLDDSWRERFEAMLDRSLARVHPQQSDPIDRLRVDPQRPSAAIDALVAAHPQAARCQVHPADVPYFVQVCARAGKPVNFVPVLDAEVRRWWRADSLWQAHDRRYDADQVLVIPGPVSVTGISRVDEPVAQLLARFEAAAVAQLTDRAASYDPSTDRPSVVQTDLDPRPDADPDHAELILPAVGRLAIGPQADLIDALLASADVTWAGRLVTNPVLRLGRASEWTWHQGRAVLRSDTVDAELSLPDSDDDMVLCTVRLGRGEVVLPFGCGGLREGAVPVVRPDAAAAAMDGLLAVAAGGRLPDCTDRTDGTNGIDGTHRNCTIEVEWTPAHAADHTAVTDPFPGESRSAGESTEGAGAVLLASEPVPDALFGLAWPAVFAVIGSATAPDGTRCVEGLWDLLHLSHQARIHSPLPQTATLLVEASLGVVTDTEAGRMLPVQVTVSEPARQPGPARLVAVFTEQFLIRHRTGTAQAGGPPAIIAEGESTPLSTGEPRPRLRLRLARYTVTAPDHLGAFAAVSGDHNPLHTEVAAARLAGLPGPIVHGMWLSAVAQRAAVAAGARRAPRRVLRWSAQWLAPLLPGQDLQVEVERIGVLDGGRVVEVTCRCADQTVLIAQAVITPPATCYTFPGQGIQHQGMGLEARNRSVAARAVWDQADQYTRTALGFSIIAVVRDNPAQVLADGQVFTHPDGVLFLTQFTQVAMATLAMAQVAELREAGVFVDGSVSCGHSVGEYNALAAVTGVIPLQPLLEIVFRRGQTMHRLVPRDRHGRSQYRLAAIRPAQAGLTETEILPFVEDVATDSGQFLEVVNHNLAGAQYAVAGTRAGLEALQQEIELRQDRFGGNRAFILIPGIDVPFHSSVLRHGVAEFRDVLDGLLPARIDPELLVGRYVPNLVPRLFSLERDFVAEVAATVPSQPLAEVLDDWRVREQDPSRLARTLLVELLAWQFASPVRWIETQELLFTDPSSGGLGIEEFIEVGVASAPTLANLAAQTLKLPAFDGVPAVPVNVARDAVRVFATDETPPEDPQPPRADPQPGTTLSTTPTDTTAPTPASASLSASAPQAQSPSPLAVPTAQPAAPQHTPTADLGFTAADATRTLVALWTKVRPEQIGAADSIETLCEGVSSRRNQLLVDLGAELGLGAIDGAAEATWPVLTAKVTAAARGYTPFGPVLSKAIAETLRTTSAAAGAKANAVADRVRETWQLGPGWVAHVSAELAGVVREGSSVRGGPLGNPDLDRTDLAALVDHAVEVVAAAHDVSVTPVSATPVAGPVDPAALAHLTESITGPDGVLAETAHHLLSRLRSLSITGASPGTDHGDAGCEEPQESTTAELQAQVTSELGPDWVNATAPVFAEPRAVLFDDRWASVREDLARVWVGDQSAASRCFTGLDEHALAQARYWLSRARSAGRADLEAFYAHVVTRNGLDSHEPDQLRRLGQWSGEVAVVTGAAPGSIAGAIVAELLRGGATVVATTSNLTRERTRFFRRLYRDHASTSAALWVVPANLASFADIDAVSDWIDSPVLENAGGATTQIRPPLVPTLVFPFAAPSVTGTAADAGPRAELEFRVLLWGLERLVTRLGAASSQHRLGQRIHVVLPGSPNRGRFGADGAYGEAKAAFDAFVRRWHAEPEWAQRVALVHAQIGWVRSTSLMGHNDALVDAATAEGIRTSSAAEMARALLALCDRPVRERAATAPVDVDLSGGLVDTDLDLRALASPTSPSSSANRTSTAAADAPETTGHTEGTAPEVALHAMTHPAGWGVSQPTADWPELTAAAEDLVVIVGAGEVGPCGSARTRLELEIEDRLSPAGVIELAWVTGLIVWEQEPAAGWHDAATREPLTEADILERFTEQLEQRCGIRRFHDDGALIDGTAPLLASVYLDSDTTFVVRTQQEAHAFLTADPQRTRIEASGDGDWTVTRLAGSEIRVPRRVTLSRFVGAQVPDGFDPTVWGLGSMAGSIDRLAAWNLVATVDAFISSGFEPAELLRWIHPTHLADTQSTGIGGMQSTRLMYVDALLGGQTPTDVLQEALPNVIAAHTVQAYLGGYGAMVHPVAACATAAVSVEEGVDKIRLGKAQVVVTGGFDDLGIEGIVGFANMSATADTAALLERGIAERNVCRPNDRRRAGFVEGQGGGTIVLARGDVAARLGLPVLAVVAYAGSFSDGIHTSIPAPGLGALGAGCGGLWSPLATGLASLGVSADDVAVISKHDTSTKANDPNESTLHERLAAALGRGQGTPLYVVSQKSLTGHAKGGAAAFQLIGMCQLLASGVIPPNRSLDCVDDALAEHEHLVWLREPLPVGADRPLRAGLVTSLGFGHVSALVALVHPGAFVATLPAQQRQPYLAAASARLVAGQARLLDGMCGGAPLYRRPVGRRFDQQVSPDQRRADELAMLVDPTARLDEHAVYPTVVPEAEPTGGNK